MVLNGKAWVYNKLPLWIFPLCRLFSFYHKKMKEIVVFSSCSVMSISHSALPLEPEDEEKMFWLLLILQVPLGALGRSKPHSNFISSLLNKTNTKPFLTIHYSDVTLTTWSSNLPDISARLCLEQRVFSETQHLGWKRNCGSVTFWLRCLWFKCVVDRVSLLIWPLSVF